MSKADDLEQAHKAYLVTHWDDEGDRDNVTLECADPSVGFMVALGDLVAITYRTTKGDYVTTDFEHDFSRPFPVLCFQLSNGKLLIAGGKYTVTARGIEG